MQELRFVAVSEDGSYAVLAVPGRSARFMLPIDERLRAVALGQVSRLAQYEIEVESPLRPKEIQARMRAGETAEEIADAAGIPVERVRWFEGPVLAERAYIAQQAQTATVRRLGDSAGPGPHLGDIVGERMTASGADPEEGQWDSRKRGDGNWQVQLTYSAAGRLHIAEWMFDPRRRHVMPEDDTAARLSLPESELPPEPESEPGEATVTPIASRLSAAAGMGGGAPPSVSRFRSERTERPERPAPERSAAERSAAERSAAERRPGDLGDRPAAGRPSAYAQPPAPPVTPSPAPPEPAFRGSAFHESERMVPTPPAPPADRRQAGAPWSDSARRPPEAPVFEDDGYQAGDYQFEDPQPREPEPAAAPEPSAAPEPTPAPAAEAPAAEAPAAEAPAAEAPAAEAPAAEAPAAEVPAVAAEEPRAPVEEPAAEAAPAPEAAPAEKASAPKVPARTAAKASSAKKEPPAKKTAAARKEPAAKSEPAPAAAASAPAAAADTADTAAKDKPAAEEQPARPRPAKKSARNRRSSVPSWDEIMLGSSRQRD